MSEQNKFLNEEPKATYADGFNAMGITPTSMTFEEYAQQGYNYAAEQKKMADKQAELAKNKQIIDANSSYMRNKATYGVNAEKMAQMGLSGGGYGDYLNAMGYTQKRSDIQNANAQYSANLRQNQATYSDYIMSLNKELAQKTLEDQRIADQRIYNEQQQQKAWEREDTKIAEQREYEKGVREEDRAYEKEMIENDHIYENGIREEQTSETMYKGILADVQDNPQNYTEEAIDKIAKEYGFSPEQSQSIKDMLKTSKENYAKDVQKYIYDTFLPMVTNINTTYTEETLRESLKLYEGLEDSQIDMFVDLLKATLTKQAEAKKSTAKAIIAENGGIMDSEIESALVDLGYTADEIAELKSDNKTLINDTYNSQLDSAIANMDDNSMQLILDEIDRNKDKFTTEEYQGFYNKVIDSKLSELEKLTYNEILGKQKDYKGTFDDFYTNKKISLEMYNKAYKDLEDLLANKKKLYEDSNKQGIFQQTLTPDGKGAVQNKTDGSATDRFSLAQNYINSHNMAESDRASWLNDSEFKKLWDNLTKSEQEQLKGTVVAKVVQPTKLTGEGVAGSASAGTKLSQKAFQANSQLVAKYGTYQNYVNGKPKTTSSSSKNKPKHR